MINILQSINYIDKNSPKVFGLS